MKNFLRITIVALLASTPALAESPPDSPEMAACRDAIDYGAYATSQLGACFEQELQRQDRRLNAEYRQLSSKLTAIDPAAVKLLVAAQRQWLTFREAWCQFEATRTGAPGPLLNRTICMVTATQRQADLLHENIPKQGEGRLVRC